MKDDWNLKIDFVYLSAHQKCDSKDFSNWITMLGVSKMTVYRYIAISSMIMRFLSLILCDLNFSHLLKHIERILTFMNKELNSKWLISLEMQLSLGSEQCVSKSKPAFAMFQLSKEYRFPQIGNHV